MGFMDSITGGIKSLTGTLFGEAPSVSTMPLSSAQSSIQKLLEQYLAKYGSQMTGATPVPTYTGQITAGLTPLQTESISKVAGLQNLGESSDVLSQIMKMVSGENFSPEYMRAAYQTGIENPLRKTFTETTMPALNSAYSKSGLFYGSDRATATQNEADTLMNALAMGRSGLESSIYTAGLENQQQGISDFANYLSTQGGLSELGMNIGKTEQETEQLDLLNKYNQWLRTQAGTMPTDTLLQAILNMYGSTGDQAIVSGGSSGALGSIASLLNVGTGKDSTMLSSLIGLF